MPPARARGRFGRVDLPALTGVLAALAAATYEQLRTALRKKVDKPPAFAGKVVYDGRMNVMRALAYVGP